MGSLKMTVQAIKDIINPGTYGFWWDNTFGTNCYAYALGLDLDEREICDKAYALGVMGAILNDIPLSKLKEMTYEERLFLDLDALQIYHMDSDESECYEYNWYYDKEKATYEELCWGIALFSSGEDFHFLRKTFDGEWWHKRGYFGPSIDWDSDRNKIVDPRECNIKGYRYVKTYKIGWKVPI